MKKLNLLKSSFIARGAFLVGAAGIANFLNFLYNAYLGRNISIEEFALISFIGSILSLSDILIGALKNTVVYKSGFILGKYKNPASVFWKKIRKRAFLLGLAATLGWVVATPFISSYFNIQGFLPILSFAPIWIFSIMSAVDGGYLTGNLLLGYMGVVAIFEAIVKLSAAYILVNTGLQQYAYLAVTISSFASFALILIGILFFARKNKYVSKRETAFPLKFYASSIFTRVSTVVYLSMDVILAKHFLNPEQAGQYALLSLAGKIIFLAGSFFSQFLTPILSNFEGKKKNSKKAFYLLLTATGASSLLAFFGIGAFGFVTMPFLFGSRAQAILPHVFMYSLSMVAFTIATTIISYHQVRGKHALPVISLVFALLQILLIARSHSSVGSISNVMALLGFIVLASTLVIARWETQISVALNNITDFFELLKPLKLQKGRGLRVLVLNWRDGKHLWAGGAEVYVDELAKRWVRDGNTVAIFCGNDGKSKRDEIVNGVRIIRRGGFYTVYMWAILYYVFKFRRNFDVIVDSENGIPFFSPLYSTKPVVLLIHHVHQEVFIEQMRFPFSYIGRFIEGKLMPFIYRNRTVVTVSESSKKEIVKVGIASDKNIQIVNPGIERSVRKFKKSSFPSITYLGRLKAYKNIDVAIRAFALTNKRIASSRMWIVGEGDKMGALKDLALKLGLEKKITFFGKVDEEEKVKILGKSWIAVQPSQVEGWGITVIEANSCGTPVVASDTKGLRDSIVDQQTGRLVKLKDVKAFAKAFNTLIINKNQLKKLSQNAYVWSKSFDWDQSSHVFYEILQREVAVKNRAFAVKRAGIIFNRFLSIF